MRLSHVFVRGGNLRPLIEEACAVDDLGRFTALLAEKALVETHPLPLWKAVRACTLSLADKAGVVAEPWSERMTRPCFAGQQPYVDYYPAVLAKLDALEASGGASFYGFGDYAPLGSDHWMSRTALPSAGAAGGLLSFNFHRSVRAQQGRDLRFVATPDSSVIAELAEKLKGMITHTAKWVSTESFSKKSAFARMRLLLNDYEEARRRADNAGEFNVLWSVRVFHRLGFRLPFVSLSELLAHDELIPSVAATLSAFIRDNELFIESIDEALQLDDGGELNFNRKEPGHVPLALADPESHVRRSLRVERSGPDYLLVSTGGTKEVFNVGSADTGTLEELLRRLNGRWSLDVFAPIFLFRLGVAGIINGRGSIRYSLVLAHVMKRLFGERHPPNLLCSCSPRLTGPFVSAVRNAYGRLPDNLRSREPTLLSRLLSSGEETIREEIAASWRDGERE